MIARSLLVAAAGLIVYGLFLLRFPSSRPFPPQGNWEENMIAGERYLLGERKESVVLVGTSLSQRLQAGPLGPDVYNLAFSGGSSLTGLEIVRHSGRVPRMIVIEENLLVKERDTALLAALFNPVLSRLKGPLPALRAEYRPASFLCGRLFPGMLRAVRGRREEAAPPPAPFDAALFARLCGAIAADWRNPANPRASAAALAAVADDLAYFRARGVRCFFLEMPVDARLARMPYPSSLRTAVLGRFPETRDAWIRFDPDADYQTIDGIHLRDASLTDVSEEVGRRIRRLLSAGGAE